MPKPLNAVGESCRVNLMTRARKCFQISPKNKPTLHQHKNKKWVDLLKPNNLLFLRNFTPEILSIQYA